MWHLLVNLYNCVCIYILIYIYIIYYMLNIYILHILHIFKQMPTFNVVLKNIYRIKTHIYSNNQMKSKNSEQFKFCGLFMA